MVLTRRFKIYSLLLQGTVLLLVVLGFLPISALFINLALVGLILVSSRLGVGLEYFILSLPFFTIIPNRRLDTFSVWRVYIGILAIRALYVFCKEKLSWRIFFRGPQVWFLAFIVFSLVSAVWARFPVLSIKQFLFLLHIYLLIPTVLVAMHAKEKKPNLVKNIAAALGIFLGFGLLQLVLFVCGGTFFFWQYWAMNGIPVFYGQAMSAASTYSNSWFNFADVPVTLRMFSLLPSSHAFGLLMFFLLCLIPNLKLNKYVQYTSILLASVAISMSQTRGVWVGLAASFGFVVGVQLYMRKKEALRHSVFIKIFGVGIACILLLPVFNYVVAVAGNTQFSSRAISVFDPNETSNSGRIKIWKQSSKFAFEHPFGTGGGNFIASLSSGTQTLSQAQEAHNSTYNLPNKYISAHNLFLHFFVEVGIIGLALFVIFLYCLGRLLWGQRSSTFMFSFLLLNIGLFTYMLFDTTILNDKILILYCILLALAHTNQLKQIES